MSIDDCLKGNTIKHEATVDLAKLRKFRRAHNAHVNIDSPDPIFKPEYSFIYKPSTCGVIVEIVCECGKNADITDYSDW